MIGAHIARIEADGRSLGSVEVVGADVLTPLQTKALEHGTTVLALELVKQQAAIDVETRLSAELLHELLACPDPTPAHLVHRAGQLGVDLAGGHHILALAAAEEPATSEASLLATTRAVLLRRMPMGTRALTAKRGGEVVVALPVHPGLAPEAIARAIQEAAAPALTGVLAGIGPLGTIGESFRIARMCLSLARGSTASGAVIDYATLGPLRFLLDARDVDQATAMVADALAPVLRRDRAARAALLPTSSTCWRRWESNPRGAVRPRRQPRWAP